MILNSLSAWKTWARTFPSKADADAPYRSPFHVLNKGSEKEPAEILVYDVIGRDFWSGEGIAANDFADKLKEIDPKARLIIGINSPGGNVSDGLAIFNMLERRGNVETRNDGMAASIASVILQAGDNRQTSESAMVMIHRAWGLMVGNANDAEQLKEVLQKHDQVIAETYARKSGKEVAFFLQKMDEETFFTGNEAKDAGLVDNVLTATKNLAPAGASNASKATAAAARTVQAQLLSEPHVAAGKPTENNAATTATKDPNMSENSTPVAAAAANPVIDLSPVITAINSLGDKLNAITTPPPGAPPVTASVQNLGNPLVERYNNLSHDRVEQSKLAKGLYNDLRKQLMISNGCGGVVLTPENRFDLHQTEIRNANTVDAALANTILAGDFVTTMRTYTAPWLGFTRRVEMSPVSKRQTLEVPLVSSAGGMQTNATNYESGDTTLAPIAIVTSEYSRSFHVTRPQTNLGLQLAALVPTNAQILGEGISALFTALMTNANYGADVVIGAAADFSSTDLPAILALGKNYTRTTMVIDGSHLAYLLPTSRESFVFGEPGAYGFDGGIYKNNLWTSGATDICGFVCGPDAIVSAWGMADGLPAGEAISKSTVEVNGFPFSVTVWFSRATREVWGSFEIVGGVAAGDKTQAEVLTTQ